MEYYKLRGTFSQTRKMEWGFAMVAFMLSRVNGGSKEMKDFMPYSAADEKELSVDDFINW
jgi:hypothetical protein